MSEKIQKLLAHYGLGSRREIERWIAARRISVNGKIAQTGDRATLKDCFRLDGHIVKLEKNSPDKLNILLYHKREGEMCTRQDPQGRKTVFDTLPRLHKGRWVMVGRLDFNTSGLLLFTNNGEVAERLMHPRTQMTRKYAVRVLGDVSQKMLDKLETGVQLEDGEAHFDEIKFGGGEGANCWYHVTLHAGRNRIVRRLWESQGIKISRLIRIRYGNISLPRTLRLGESRQLSTTEIRDLLAVRP